MSTAHQLQQSRAAFHPLPTDLRVRNGKEWLRIAAWSDMLASGPSRDFSAYFRVKARCEDCDGTGILEREYCAHSAAIEPSYAHAECDFCEGDGVYVTDVDCEQGDALWAHLVATDAMTPEVRRAAEMAAAAQQAEHDERERNYAEREAAAQ